MSAANRSLILAIAIFLTLGILGWRMMQPPTPVTIEETADLAQFRTRLLQATTRIERIHLEEVATTIQQDPAYRALVDFSRPLPNLPVGRENPFEPISNEVGEETQREGNAASFSGGDF